MIDVVQSLTLVVLAAALLQVVLAPVMPTLARFVRWFGMLAVIAVAFAIVTAAVARLRAADADILDGRE